MKAPHGLDAPMSPAFSRSYFSHRLRLQRRGVNAQKGGSDYGKLQVMATKRKHENDIQRLAKGLRTNQKHARTQPGGKSSPRSRPGREPRGKMADARPVSPIVRLIQSLGEEKRFVSFFL